MNRSPICLGMLRTLRPFWSGLLASQPPIGRPNNGKLHSEGFLRVRLGDLFDNQRYKDLRKLGYGQYSTVWLSRHDRMVVVDRSWSYRKKQSNIPDGQTQCISE